METEKVSRSILKIVTISDTHSGHHQLQLPPGDILIHCGDFSKSRTKLNSEEYTDFLAWFSSQEHRTKILIAGNRDDFMHTEVCHKYRSRSLEEIQKVQEMFTKNKDIIYLCDSSYQHHQHGVSITIWGSPWTRLYGKEGKAFQVSSQELKQKWDLIPEDTNILVTHGPPLGICDQNLAKQQAGCPELLDKVKWVKPQVHVFGHIHEGYGTLMNEDTLFINAASIDKVTKKLTNEPVVIGVSPDLSVELLAGGHQPDHGLCYQVAQAVHPHNTGCEIV